MKQKAKYLGSVLVLTIFLNTNMMAQRLYFSSPQESVKLTSKLLIEEDWKKLSNYYFLENSSKKTIDSLHNGSYFIRDKKPPVGHSGISWKYKNPFSPQFKYLSHVEVEKDHIKVTVSIKIDQGKGMIQQGMSSFYLIRVKKGYQLLLQSSYSYDAEIPKSPTY